VVRDRALRRLAGAAALVPLGFLAYFFVYPVLSILASAFFPPGGFGLDAFRELAARRSLLGVAWFTVWQAVVSTLVTVAVGIPGAHALARHEFRGRKLVRAATIVPFVMPTVVVGSAFLALLGRNGALGIDMRGTVWLILAAHVFYNYAVVVRTVGTAWERMDPRIEEAARVLGASPWRTFRSVTLPMLRPAIASAASIVFLFTLTSFGVILILGNLATATIEVEIWRLATSLIDLRGAAALATIQLVAVTAVLFAYSRYQERRSVQVQPAAARPTRPATWRQRALLAANLGFMATLLLAPLAVLVERALRVDGGYGIGNFRRLLVDTPILLVKPVASVAYSLAYAAGATVVAVTIGLMAAAVVARRRGLVGRWFDTVLMLPLGTSAVTLGFGFLVALDEPVDIRAAVWLVAIGHALVAIPFVVRITVPIMRSIRVRLREAAAVLGASPARVWREVDLPVIGRAALVAAGFSLAVSLGEFGATSFLARPDAPTMPVAIYRFLSRPGSVNFGVAMALSVVLMVVTTVAVLAVERLRPDDTSGF